MMEALETVLLIKKKTGNTILSQEIFKQFGNNIMTKLILEAGKEIPLNSHDLHFKPEPEWMEMKRRRASLILSTSILLELNPDAIFNSLLESGENTPKTIETLIGPPLKNFDEAVDAIGKFIRDQKFRVIQDNIEKTGSKRKPKTPEKPLKRTTAELLKQGLDEYEKKLAKESKNEESEDVKPSKKSDQSEKAKNEYKTPKTKIKKDEL